MHVSCKVSKHKLPEFGFLLSFNEKIETTELFPYVLHQILFSNAHFTPWKYVSQYPIHTTYEKIRWKSISPTHLSEPLQIADQTEYQGWKTNSSHLPVPVDSTGKLKPGGGSSQAKSQSVGLFQLTCEKPRLIRKGNVGRAGSG